MVPLCGCYFREFLDYSAPRLPETCRPGSRGRPPLARTTRSRLYNLLFEILQTPGDARSVFETYSTALLSLDELGGEAWARSPCSRYAGTILSNYARRQMPWTLRETPSVAETWIIPSLDEYEVNTWAPSPWRPQRSPQRSPRWRPRWVPRSERRASPRRTLPKNLLRNRRPSPWPSPLQSRRSRLGASLRAIPRRSLRRSQRRSPRAS